MPAPRRLPGILMDVTPPPPVEVLPRMDVAVFAGFAATGPAHTPVAIEGIEQYAGVFGEDLPLAFDAGRGERVYANLGPAVRAFFSGGGRRCWVIRLAWTPGLNAEWDKVPGREPKTGGLACANRFAVPGVLALTAAGTAPALLQARSLGSWSDPLRVSAALAAVGFELDGCVPLSSPPDRRFRFSTRAMPQVGDLIELGNGADVAAGTLAGGLRVYAIIEKATPGTDAKGQPQQQVEATLCAAFEPVAASPPLLAEGVAWREAPLELPSPPPIHAASLSLDLQVSAGSNRLDRLSGVGLTLAHPNGWWRLVSDDVFYATSGQSGATPVAANPFPLAAEDRKPGSPPILAWIPLGVTPLYGEASGPLPQQATALEREGLSHFDTELFLDPGLAQVGVDTLAGQADVIRYLADAPRRLFGIHAALSIGTGGLFNEASLIAVPDAAHLGWVRREVSEPLPVPKTSPKTPAHWLAHRGPCAGVSEGTSLEAPDFGRFLDCATRRLAQPAFLSGPVLRLPRGFFRLRWEQKPESLDGFSLEESVNADFSDAREIYRGTARASDVSATREGVFYYRVTAYADDERSAPSDVLTVVVCDDAWVSRMPEDFQADGEAGLLRLQRALLRLAAAGGDLFAVLGLPRHYRAPESIRHAARLRSLSTGLVAGDWDGLALDERRALSYGALYHPWVEFPAQPSGPAGGLRVCPPDGIAVGLLSDRATRRGAWVAPANQPFKDVVALTPPIGDEARAALLDAQVNLVLADPRGFLTLSADTLSDDPDWRPINVRRLFILLKRLAVRRGASYVFEPNGDVLRRAVERGFSLLLTDLFRRGAFAGATAAESFRVVTGGGQDTARDRELGRFFVELRVAPARPLEFLTVRLLQSGERLTVMEEV
ncbi:hypothetical protein MYXO_02164 [Myxococcaceae bacterium]|nr:hypothetical protein MYXO_02164 [Myxococcaceae bacterium]